MLTMEHELPLQLIDNRPDLIVRLARTCGLGLPERATPEVVCSDLTRITPVTERRADRVVLLRDPAGEIEGVVVVEVQRRAEAEARMRWPGKVATAYEKHGRDTYLMVICPDAGTANWAGEPVVIGQPEGPGMVLRMVVVPPSGIPMVTNAKQAKAEPELAVLSVLGHGAHPTHGEPVTSALLEGFRSYLRSSGRGTTERKHKYGKYLYGLYDLVTEDVRKRIEDFMTTIDTENSQAWFSFPPLVKARVAARREGHAEGEAEGQLRGEANSLLLVLRRRGIQLNRAQEARVLRCDDQSRLENWLLRAATADTIQDVFDDALDDLADPDPALEPVAEPVAGVRTDIGAVPDPKTEAEIVDHTPAEDGQDSRSE